MTKKNKERGKHEKPSYDEIRGMITKIVSKYKLILRTKDEMADLQQDAYIVYYDMSNYIEKKYGKDVRNFNTMLYNAIAWEINRLVDKKYLLIKKGVQSTKGVILSTDVDPTILLDNDNAYEFDNYIDSKLTVIKLLDNLNDVEEYIIIKNFGLDGEESMSLSKISENLGISYYKVCLTKKIAIMKIKDNLKNKGD